MSDHGPGNETNSALNDAAGSGNDGIGGSGNANGTIPNAGEGSGTNTSTASNGSGQPGECPPPTVVDANGNGVDGDGRIRVTDRYIPSSHGGSPHDYLNVDSYGVGDTGTEALPPIENLYQPFEGFAASSYRAAVAEMTNPNASWDERIVNGALATLAAPVALIDMMGEGIVNAPNAAARAGQLFARGNVTNNTETRVTSTLSGIVEMTNAFTGAAGPFAGAVGVPARVMTAQELALQRFQGSEAARAARATYGALEARTPAQTLANIENRFANSPREVGFVVDARTGQILGVTRSGLDNGAQMRLNPDTDFRLMAGNVFTHNHPRGGTFSAEDVRTALSAAVTEFRAVSSTRTMSITFENPPANLVGNPASAYDFINGEMAAIGASYRAGIANGSLVPPADLAAREIWRSNYFMERLVERNPWIHYTNLPR
jgi:hypothetical protein